MTSTGRCGRSLAARPAAASRASFERGHGLDDQQVDAARRRARGSARRRRRAPRRGRFCPAARGGRRAGRRSRPPRLRRPASLADGRRPGAARRTPAALISATLPPSPWRARRKRLAPKVLVSRISAPACRYSSWMDRIRFGIGEIQLVVAAVDEDAARVEHGAHGAVGEHGPASEDFGKLSHSVAMLSHRRFARTQALDILRRLTVAAKAAHRDRCCRHAALTGGAGCFVILRESKAYAGTGLEWRVSSDRAAIANHHVRAGDPRKPHFAEVRDFEEEQSLVERRRRPGRRGSAGRLWHDHLFCGPSVAAQRVDQSRTDRRPESRCLDQGSAGDRGRLLRHPLQLQRQDSELLHLRVLRGAARQHPEHARRVSRGSVRRPATAASRSSITPRRIRPARSRA